MNTEAKRLRATIKSSFVGLIAVLAVIGVMFGTSAYGSEPASAGQPVEQLSAEQSNALPYGLIAAAVAFAFGAIGAGFAISHVGAAAMGAVAEKPQIAGQALIFVALAEGIVVFGFITALMILGKIG